MRQISSVIFRFIFWGSAFGALLAGCASVPRSSSQKTPPSASISSENDCLNPLFIEISDPHYLWESVVDVIDNYFPTPHEYPIQTYRYQDENGQEQSVQTEGRIDTEPVIAAGILEPWKKNSVTCSQRVEATFQTVRRYAVVRVVPEEGGYNIHLAVYDEWEDLAQPMNAATTGSNLLFTDDLSQIEYPNGSGPVHQGWIPMGRNREMETYILQEIAWRLQNEPTLINPENSAVKTSARNNNAQSVPIIP